MNRIIRFRNGPDLLSQLHDDFNRLVAPLERQYDSRLSDISAGEWVPKIDVKEEDKKYVIHADIPGVKANDIDVHMENGILTIKGTRKSEVKEEKDNYIHIERSSGSFLRQMTLPEKVDEEKIQAKCSDGVLEVTLPKASQNVGRKIKVDQG